MEDWAYIRRLAAEGVPKTAIAEELGISRTTVIKLAAMTEPPRYERTPTSTSFVTVEPRVRALLAEFPDLPGSVLAERVGLSGCADSEGTCLASEAVSGTGSGHASGRPSSAASLGEILASVEQGRSRLSGLSLGSIGESHSPLPMWPH